MEIKNSEIVSFFKNGASIRDLKIPRKLFTAVSLNISALQESAKLYDAQHQEILSKFVKKDGNGKLIIEKNSYVIEDAKGYEEEMQELLDIKVNLEVQTVSEETLDLMEEKDKFDALTGQQLMAIEFMVEN